MPLYSKESLETLRCRVNLIEALAPHVELNPAGGSYKGLCPFHDEKTPSFVIQKGAHHYHCFGCGAHGDAIQFLMSYLKLSFVEAIESLAEKFQVKMELIETKSNDQGPNKKLLKDALEKATRFFHFYLLHTSSGHQALRYLTLREMSLSFIRQFQIGLAPGKGGMLRKILHEQKISDEIMLACGLLKKKSDGRYRDFFADRITFPVHAPSGSVIGFSARKFKEETFGGKYVNTPETPLFKKSRILFGLNYCRRQIAKQRRVIVVEGQIDALRLIHEGFDFTVAGQGTAFGENHLRELVNLGVNHAYLALDSDDAGKEAAVKIGNQFQHEGIDVTIVNLPQGSDPDTFIREEGAVKFEQLLAEGQNYLNYVVTLYSRTIDPSTPAGKNALVQKLTTQIRNWKHSLMVHESLRKLSHLLQVPEDVVGVGMSYNPNLLIKKSANVGPQTIDPVRILETDFLRWLLLAGPKVSSIAACNIQPSDLQDTDCQRIYSSYLQRASNQLHCDLLHLMQEEEDQEFLLSIMDKKVDREKPEEHFLKSIQKILELKWMEKRESLKRQIQSGQSSEKEVLRLVKEFDLLRKQRPQVVIPKSSGESNLSLPD